MGSYGIFFMIHSIAVESGGMTRAALNRGLILKKYNKEIGFITFDFNPGYDHVIGQLKQSGLWDDHMKLYNVFHYLMSSFLTGKGQPKKVTLQDLKTKKIIKEQYWTPEGQCFFEVIRNRRNKEIINCFWYNPDNTVKKAFKDMKEVYKYYLEATLSTEEEAVLLSDGRFTDKLLLSINNPGIAKVALLHSNHLQFPYEYGSTIVKRNATIIHNLDKLDAFVTLTERQAKDIGNRFGHRTTIHVVGHPSISKVASYELNKEPFTAVMVARYQGIKQIHHAIYAFKKVVSIIPQAKLEIWGFGDERHKYERLIKKLHLENHVWMKGFTNHVSSVYQKAAFSISTSKSEAFGMAIVESMSEGTPVISYDCKYGPGDIIEHNRNGILIEANDIKTLAKVIIQLFTNEEKRKALSLESSKISNKFGEEMIGEKWIGVFEAAITQKNQRVQLGKMVAGITKVQYICNGLFLEGAIYIKEQSQSLLIKENLKLSLQFRRRSDMEDVYVPLAMKWLDNQKINFKGEITDFHQFKRGTWDMNLSCSCLNAHQFVKPLLVKDFTTDYKKKKFGNLILKLRKQKNHIQLKVYKSNVNQKLKLKVYFLKLLNRYKAKVRDRIRAMGFLK